MAIGVSFQKLRVIGQPVRLSKTAAAYLCTAHGLLVADEGADTTSWHLFNSLEEGLAVMGSGNATPSTVAITYSFSAATLGETIAVDQEVSDGTYTWVNKTLWTAAGGETSVTLDAECLSIGPATNVSAGTVTTVGTGTGTLTITSCTNNSPATGGAWPSSPDLDYTAEHILWLHFEVYKAGPVIMKNVYDKTTHTGGVSTVTSADFITAMGTMNDMIAEVGRVPQWFAVPGYATKAYSLSTGDADDIALFDKMLAEIDHLGLFKMNIVVDYDHTETTVATVVSNLGSGSYYRQRNVNVGWPKLNGYFASVHKICAFAKNMLDSEKGNGQPYWSAGNTDTTLLYESTDIVLNFSEVSSLVDVGCFTFFKYFDEDKVVLWGDKTAYYLSSRAATPDDAGIYDFDGATNQANWNNNQTVLLLWKRLSAPFNRANVNAVINDINTLGEIQTDQGAQLGYRVEFLESDNPTADLIAGKIKPRQYFLPAGSISEIEIIPVLDYSFFRTLFS